MRTLLLGASVILAGCVHRVRIESEPPGATVEVDGRVVGVTPMERELRWWPFRKAPATVRLEGHRDVPIDLSKRVWLRRIWRDVVGRGLYRSAPRFTHTVRLVEEHGQAGTWTREEALNPP
jgi:hypothetical protein